MRSISSKQRRINSELAKIKKTLGTRCAICGREGHDLSHILPRSLYPEYQTDHRNLQILCRECHRRFDDDREFRRRQTSIVERAKMIDELATNRYFEL
jgi:5-methylcytosine-specific restriction endonuclease McrA